MKRTLQALVALLLLALAGAALAGIRLTPTSKYHYDFTDCDGGQGQTVAQGSYLASFKDETVWLCVGDAGCVSGGQFFPAGVVVTLSITPDAPLSCRSTSMTGDVALQLIASGVGP